MLAKRGMMDDEYGFDGGYEGWVFFFLQDLSGLCLWIGEGEFDD